MNNRWYYHEIFKTSRKFYHEIFILEQNLRNHGSFFATKVWNYMVKIQKEVDFLLSRMRHSQYYTLNALHKLA